MTRETSLEEISAGKRFAFGQNWSQFVPLVDENRIQLAEQSLRSLLNVEDLKGKRFLDVGSGSGLFSLAARRMGALVRSFDYDPQSVASTNALRERFFPNDPQWTVERGSVLDQSYLASLGSWDVVYSWGVLHHTGAMWQALTNLTPLVAPNGLLFIAIYNDQGRASERWLQVKQAYNSLPGPLRWLVLIPATLRLWGPTFIRDIIHGRPLSTWRSYATHNLRGMSPWRDLIDWVGGLPFEVAKPEEIIDACTEKGFSLRRLRTMGGGLACNEFVFVKSSDRDATSVSSLNA